VHRHGPRKGSADGSLAPHWILKFDIFLLTLSRKMYSLSFKLVKWNFTTVSLQNTIFWSHPGKSHCCAPGKNPSDAHFPSYKNQRSYCKRKWETRFYCTWSLKMIDLLMGLGIIAALYELYEVTAATLYQSFHVLIVCTQTLHSQRRNKEKLPKIGL